jgi:PAS domain S-box-containing protein
MLNQCLPFHDFTLSNTLPSIIQNPMQLLRHLWEGVNYGIFILDVLEDGNEFCYSAFNPTLARISPIPVEQLLGKTLTEALPENMATLYRDRYRECIRLGQPISFEENFCHEGQTTSWLLTVNPLGTSLNHSSYPIDQLLITALEISDRHQLETQKTQAEIALIENEAKFRRLVEDANDIIATWELDGTITYLSPSFQTFLGHEITDWIGQSFEPLVHPDDLSVCVIGNQQVAETGEKRAGIEFRHQHQQGHWVWIAINISPIKDETGRVVAFQGILRDVSDRKAAEMTLRDYADRLQQTLRELQRTQAQMLQSEKMSSLGQLVAGIAHEINNPVNFIHGNVSHVRTYAQELLELIRLYQQTYPQPDDAIAHKTDDIDFQFLNEDLPKLLQSMQVGTERIREIVKSLRLFSRLDEAEVKPVDIHDGIDSTLMILQNRLKSKVDRPEIQIIKKYGTLPEVECFAGQLNQVFMNILANAIDALESAWNDAYRLSGNEQLIITISTERQGDRIVIRFSDNGVGIPETIQNQIFDPFFTTKPVGCGTGMGMSISYQIVTEKHGGQISCHSTLGQGTEFVIQIPVQQK